MMAQSRPNWRKRYVSATMLALGLLLLNAASHRAIASAKTLPAKASSQRQPAFAGLDSRLNVARLPGWSAKSSAMEQGGGLPRTSILNQDLTGNGYTFRLRFEWYPVAPHDMQPRTQADLEQSVLSTRALAQRSVTQMRVIESRPTKVMGYPGHSAYESWRDNRGNMYVRSLQFISPRGRLVTRLFVSGNGITPAAQRRAEKAWQRVLQHWKVRL